MTLKKLKKRGTLFPDLQEMHELPKIGENCQKSIPALKNLYLTYVTLHFKRTFHFCISLKPNIL